MPCMDRRDCSTPHRRNDDEVPLYCTEQYMTDFLRGYLVLCTEYSTLAREHSTTDSSLAVSLPLPAIENGESLGWKLLP